MVLAVTAASFGIILWKIPIDQAALGNKEYIIVLALGDGVANKDGREKGTVCWLDGNGNNEKGSFASGEGVTYLHAAEKGVMVGNDRDYTGVTYAAAMKAGIIRQSPI